MNVLIVSGGNFDKDFIIKYLENKKFDKIIAVDGGLKYCKELNLEVNYIIGDFDTVEDNILQEYMNKSEISRYLPEKDETDTELAIQKAISLNPSKIVILCGTGTRLDHSLTTIGLMMLPLKYNIPCYIVDKNNMIQLIDNEFYIRKDNKFGKYISLIPYTEKVTGVYLSGFKYPLINGEFLIRQISNL